ncbi:MAG: hypothetical protein LUG47_04545 [Clostridiales bacterium]|nr:hypothetical protein [Clostridiales bacterium]
MEERVGMSITAEERERRIGTMLSCLLGSLLFFLAFYATYHLLAEVDASDFTVHLGWADEFNKWTLLQALFTGSDRLWHAFVWLLNRLGVELIYAGCLVTAGAVEAAYVIYNLLFKEMLRWLDRRLIPFASLTLCLVSAIYVPWYTTTIYRGQSSPNVWHNPTQMMVRPFALIAFWMTVRIYKRLRKGDGWSTRAFESKGEIVAYAFVLMLTVWAKPSFVQAFIPGLAILMIVDLIRSRGKAFLFCFKTACAYIPAALLVLMNFISNFGSDSASGIEIAFLDVWSHSTDNIPFSFLLLFDFPLFVFIVDWKQLISSVEGQLSLSNLGVAVVMKATLAETGSRRYHGNLSWSYGLAAVFVWFIALRSFLELMFSDRLTGKKYTVVAVVGWTLLALHLLTGILYYIKIVSGEILF